MLNDIKDAVLDMWEAIIIATLGLAPIAIIIIAIMILV